MSSMTDGPMRLEYYRDHYQIKDENLKSSPHSKNREEKSGDADLLPYAAFGAVVGMGSDSGGGFGGGGGGESGGGGASVDY